LAKAEPSDFAAGAKKGAVEDFVRSGHKNMGYPALD
jgi:hypothetical protein